MSSLQLNFSDVYTKVSEQIGWGTSPGVTNLALAKAVVHRGYMRFLQPVDMRTGQKHTWSFLVKHTILNTENDKWIYNLPTDFHSLYSVFTHEKDSGYPPMQSTTIAKINQMRAGVDSTNFPHFYSIRTGPYVKEIGTTYEVAFFETPNANYRLNYSYIIRPPELSAATDLFVGGDFASDVILEHSLAIAEQEYDEVLGTHTQMAQQLTQQLIVNDEPIIPDSVGRNLDVNIKHVSFERPLPLTQTDSIYPS